MYFVIIFLFIIGTIINHKYKFCCIKMKITQFFYKIQKAN